MSEDSNSVTRIRIPAPLKDLIAREAKQRRLLESEFLDNAVSHYVNCTRKNLGETTPTLKHIITSYPGKCSKCGDPIPVGSAALWGKGILICLNCQIAGTGDKALAKKYVKMREIQSIIRGLNKIAEELADAVFDPDFLKRQEDFQRKLSEAIEKYERHFNTTGAPEEERRALEDLLHTLREADRIQKGLDDFLFMHLQKLKKKPKAKEAA